MNQPTENKPKKSNTALSIILFIVFVILLISKLHLLYSDNEQKLRADKAELSKRTIRGEVYKFNEGSFVSEDTGLKY